MIRGNLDRLHLGDLLHWLELGGQTGRLTLTDTIGERRLDFLHGRIVYVSCNPSTLARDLKLFCEDKYELLSVQPVDMFPHTAHIESVAHLVLKGK